MSDSQITIQLPRVKTHFDGAVYTFLIEWGEYSRKINCTPEFMNFQMEEVGREITKILSELCAEAKPFSVSFPKPRKKKKP